MNAMAAAVTKALKVPSRMERIFNHVKEHPNITAAACGGALKMEGNTSSSLMSQMAARGMLSWKDVPLRVRSGKGFATLPVKHYSVALREYTLLPVPKKGAKPAKKFAKTEVVQTPAPLPTPKLHDTPVPGNVSLDDFIERLSIRDARVIYQRLDKLFGS